MSYVAADPDAEVGAVVGDGHCVSYVKHAAGCPLTPSWRSGAKARTGKIVRGTAIATFQNGVYGNFTDGRSHAAIYLSQTRDGLVVYDQWHGQPVHQRVIRFKAGQGDARNDGDAFTVIEQPSLVVRMVAGVRSLPASVGRAFKR